jgi:predicted MPP superfamily phosphohydrolase
MPIARVRELVERTNALAPDLVVLLGDFVGTSHFRDTADPEALGEALGGLRARLGTFAVLGNHDWWFNGPRIRASLERAWIAVLDDRTVPLTFNGARFWLGGIPDEYTQLPDPPGLVEHVPGGEPIVLLTHNPDVFPRVPSRVALTLAGHTHGGQVRLPLLGARVVPSRYGQRYARGHVVEHGHDLFVTTGVGTSILPVRFGVPPELALLRLF